MGTKTNNWNDITEHGGLPWYEILDENDELFDYTGVIPTQTNTKKLTQKQLEELQRLQAELRRLDLLRDNGIIPYVPGSFDLMHYDPHRQSLSDSPYVTEFADTDTSYGTSRYDSQSPIAFNPETGLMEERALNQSGLAKAANGLAKGVGIAAGTFVDGMLGTVGAISNLIAEAASGNIHSFSDALYATINNPISASIANFERSLENVLPNYRTLYEMNTPWYERIFTANTIFDGFLKNAGYAVGAALAGKVSAAAMGSIMGAQKNLDVIRGLAEKAGTNVDDVLRGAKLTGAPEEVAEQLAALGKKARQSQKLMSWTGTIMLSGSEARFEALNAVLDLFDRNLLMQEDLRYQLALGNIQQDMWMADKDHIWFEYAPQYNSEGLPVGWQRQLTQAGLNEYNTRLAQLNMQHVKTQEELAKQKADMANRIFLENMAILTFSNFIQNASWFADPVNFNLRSGAKPFKIAKDGSVQALKKSPAAAVLKDLAMEGPFEEGLQGVASRGEEYYTNKRLNDWVNEQSLEHSYMPLLDVDTSKEITSWIDAIGKSFAEQYGNAENWEEMISGFLTPLLIPGKIRVGKHKDGSPRELFLPGAQVAHTWNEAKEYNELNQRLISSETGQRVLQYYNKNRDRYEGLIQGAVEVYKYHKIAQEKLEEGDEEGYASAKHAETIVTAAMSYRLGMMQEYRDLLKALQNESNYTPLVINQIREELIKRGENDVDDQTLILSIVQSAKEASEDVEQYVKIFKGLDTLYSDRMDTGVLREIAWAATRADKFERTMYKDAEDAVRQINAQVDLANLDRIEPLPHINLTPVEGEDNFLLGEDKGVDRTGLIKTLEKHPELLKFAKQSEAFKRFENHFAARMLFLKYFTDLATNPRSFDEMVMKKYEEEVNLYLNSYIKDLSEDLNEINSVLDFKEKFDTSNVPFPWIKSVFEQLRKRTNDKDKLALIDAYEQLSIFGNLINMQIDALNKMFDEMILTHPLAANEYNVLRLKIEDFRKAFNDKMQSNDVSKQDDLAQFITELLRQLEDLVSNPIENVDNDAVHEALNTLVKANGDSREAKFKFDDKTSSLTYNEKSIDLNQPFPNNVTQELIQLIKDFMNQMSQNRELTEYTHDILKQIVDSINTNHKLGLVWKEALDIKPFFKSNDAKDLIPQDIADLGIFSSNAQAEMLLVAKGFVDIVSDKKLYKRLDANKLISSVTDNTAYIKSEFVDAIKAILDSADRTNGGNQQYQTQGKVIGEDPNGNIDGNPDNATTPIFISWGLTLFGIDDLKQKVLNDKWLDEQYKKDNGLTDRQVKDMQKYIAFCKNQGIYDFVDKGFVAEAVNAGMKFKIAFIQSLSKYLFLALENDAIQQNSNKLSKEFKAFVDSRKYTINGKEYVLASGFERLKLSHPNEEVQKASSNAWNAIKQSIQDNADAVLEEKEVTIQRQNIGSGRISIHQQEASANRGLKDILNLEQMLKEGTATFGISFNGIMKVVKDGINYVSLNEYNNTNNGNVVIYVKAADGKWYPKTTLIQNVSTASNDYNNIILKLIKNFMTTQSNLDRMLYREQLKRYIYLNADLDLSMEGNDLVLRDRKAGTILIRVTNEVNAPEKVLQEFANLKFRYLITLADLRAIAYAAAHDALQLNLLWQNNIIQTNLERADNVNAAFIINMSDITNKDTSDSSANESNQQKSDLVTLNDDKVGTIDIEIELQDGTFVNGSLTFNGDEAASSSLPIDKVDRYIVSALEDHIKNNPNVSLEGEIEFTDLSQNPQSLGTITIKQVDGKLRLTINYKVNDVAQQAANDEQTLCNGKDTAGLQEGFGFWDE